MCVCVCVCVCVCECLYVCSSLPLSVSQAQLTFLRTADGFPQPQRLFFSLPPFFPHPLRERRCSSRRPHPRRAGSHCGRDCRPGDCDCRHLVARLLQVGPRCAALRASACLLHDWPRAALGATGRPGCACGGSSACWPRRSERFADTASGLRAVVPLFAPGAAAATRPSPTALASTSTWSATTGRRPTTVGASAVLFPQPAQPGACSPAPHPRPSFPATLSSTPEEIASMNCQYYLRAHPNFRLLQHLGPVGSRVGARRVAFGSRRAGPGRRHLGHANAEKATANHGGPSHVWSPLNLPPFPPPTPASGQQALVCHWRVRRAGPGHDHAAAPSHLQLSPEEERPQSTCRCSVQTALMPRHAHPYYIAASLRRPSKAS